MNRYRNPALKQLADQQVRRFTPVERKLEQLARAEALLSEVEPGRSYPYQFVCFRITEYRPDTWPDLVIEGDELASDLRQFIEDVSAGIEIPLAEAGEPVLSIGEVSERYSISTKTVSRWRDRGLVARRFVVDGRRRVGFLQSSVERFVNLHRAEVERSARFSQLSDEERDEILRRARRMACVPSATLAEVGRRIAKRLGRSPETIRYTIKNHDREHPERAIFPQMRGPLDEQMKANIFDSYRHGASIETLAQKFRRTRSSVYRIINEIRAERILAQPLLFMHHPMFDEPNADAEILHPEPVAGEGGARAPRPPAGLPPYLQSLYEVPLLSREEEQHLFQKMNYLLYKAKRQIDAIDVRRVKASQLDEIDQLQEEAMEVKRRIIRANLRLVVSIAKRHVNTNANLFELISDGNVSLMRAVEKFDFGRGFKFSTYASWAIMKNFARTIPAENLRRDRFQTGQETAFELAPDVRTDPYEEELSHRRIHTAVEKILDRLDDRERKIIMYRYGLTERLAPQTLEEVGNKFGVTKERIRQIEARAISKLRRYASEDKLDFSMLG